MNELSGKKLVSIFFSTIMVIIMKNYDDNDEILLKKNQLIMSIIVHPNHLSKKNYKD